MKEYQRIPLDFNQKEIIQNSEKKLIFWLEDQKLDGVRIDLPIEFNQLTRSYEISYKTIQRFDLILKNIQKKSKPK